MLETYPRFYNTRLRNLEILGRHICNGLFKFGTDADKQLMGLWVSGGRLDTGTYQYGNIKQSNY